MAQISDADLEVHLTSKVFVDEHPRFQIQTRDFQVSKSNHYVYCTSEIHRGDPLFHVFRKHDVCATDV